MLIVQIYYIKLFSVFLCFGFLHLSSCSRAVFLLFSYFFYFIFARYSYKMDFIDIIFAIILGWAAFRGLRKGLFVEFASLVSFIIGIYIAVKFSHLFGGFLVESKTAKIASFLITFIGVVIVIHFLAKVFSTMVDTLFLGWLNKLGGAVFAIVKTILLLGIVLNVFQKINVDNVLVSKETQEKSLFYTPILKTSEFMLPVLKDWFAGFKKGISEEKNTE